MSKVQVFVINSEKVIVEERHPHDVWVWENGLRVRKAKGNIRDVKLPPPLRLDRDIVDYLLEDLYGRDAVDDILDDLRKQKQ